jgi:hypothetical protein
MKLTGAAILVSRGMKILQAAPAAYPYRSAAEGRNVTATRRYAIQHDPDAVFAAGVTTAGEAVLAGAASDGSIVTIWFGTDGTLRRGERITGPAESPAAWAALARWQTGVGFSPTTINVGRFWVGELSVGINDLPQFMHDYLGVAPDEGDAGFVPGLYEDIEAFIRDEQFVLIWCGKEFWMSREGEITDT